MHQPAHDRAGHGRPRLGQERHSRQQKPGVLTKWKAVDPRRCLQC